MKFGAVATTEALGSVLAHSQALGSGRLRKGTVLTEENIRDLLALGVESIIVATLSPDDPDEDRAATVLAKSFTSPGIVPRPANTGRVNLHAEASGLFQVDRAQIDAFNAVSPHITVATLASFTAVQAGQMVATVKIIPFAVSKEAVGQARRAIATNPLQLSSWVSKAVALIQTRLPGTTDKVLDKTRHVTDARLAVLDSVIVSEHRCAHETAALAACMKEFASDCDLIIVFGASAVSDDDDVIPAAVRSAGGLVERVGMPVDPGNLLVLGSLHGRPILGAPGCARSPKENGFDWILRRVIAGVGTSATDIAAMGVGGLLEEIAVRAQPRERQVSALPVRAVVLAAGKSTRMGAANKLVQMIGGKPMVRHAVEAALETGLGTDVITGHDAAAVRRALEGLPVGFVDNPDFDEGLSSSIRAAARAHSTSGAGLLVLLGDMPDVSAAMLGKLIAAFQASSGQAVIRASSEGQPGNPIILPSGLVPLAAKLSGDVGARHLIEASGLAVRLVEIGPAAALDIDTPEALLRATTGRPNNG